MNVHEARGNDEEMAVMEIEAVFLRKFVPDVFAEMGKVAVDDGASVGDAALVVAADGKSEAAGLMVFQRLFHEEIEGSTGEEAGFLVLEEVRVPDGDVNTGNAECDEEGQEKGLPVDGFEDGAGGNQGAGEEEAVDLFFVFLVFRCSRCDEAEDEVELVSAGAAVSDVSPQAVSASSMTAASRRATSFFILNPPMCVLSAQISFHRFYYTGCGGDLQEVFHEF